MGFRITVEPGRHVFETKPGETILAAARRDFVGQCGLPEEEFIADTFKFASDAKAEAAPG